MAEKRNDNGREPGTGRFTPGNPGGGRKPMSPEVREMLEAATPLAVQRLTEALSAEKYVGLDGRAVPDWKARALAAEVILDRLYGKPAQAITDGEGNAIPLGIMIVPAKVDE